MRLAPLLCAALIAAPPLAAQDWPSRPVRLVVPLAPGGQPDIVARLVAQPLGERLGQPAVVENRPGAQTNVGMESVARSAPDGSTFLVALTSLAINPHLQAQGFDPSKDLVAVAPLARTKFALVSSPALPVNSVHGLLAWARAQPGRLICAHAGGITQIGCARFALHNRVELTQAPYRSNTLAHGDLARGDVHILFDGVANLRADRSRVLDTAQALGGFDLTGWIGVLAPAGTPEAILARMNRELGEVLALPAVRRRLDELGVEPWHEAPGDFAAFLRREHERFGRVIRESGMRRD